MNTPTSTEWSTSTPLPTVPAAQHDGDSASLAVVLTTVASREQAQTLARALVAQRLVACAQIDAIESVYVWEGAVQQEPECRLWLKTTAECVPATVAALRAQHPYTLPQIVVLGVQASADYARWVSEVTSGAAQRGGPVLSA